jgi:hypothetical protein
VPEQALREAIALDPVAQLGVLDRVVECRRSELLGKGQERGLVRGRFLVVTGADRDDPAVSLERQHERAAPRSAGRGEVEQSQPVAGCVVGNVVHGSGVGEVDADRSLFGQRRAHRLQDVERERPAARGVYDEVGGQALGLAVVRGAAYAGDSRAARLQRLHAGALAGLEVAARLYQPPRRQLEQRARHGVGGDTEIALRERIEAGALDPHVESGSDRDRAARGEIALEAREQLFERILTAPEQPVHVPTLWDAGPVLRLDGERVALQDQHALEVIG